MPRLSLAFRIVAAVFIALAASCAHTVDMRYMQIPAAALPSKPPQLLAAPGMVPVGLDPALNQPGAAEVSGLYFGGGPEYCCWVAKTGRVRLSTPGGKTVAVFVIFVPDIPTYRSGRQALTVQLGQAPAQTTRDLLPGPHEVRVGLPASAVRHASIVDAAFQTTLTFVPKDVGMGADVRVISIALKRVYYR